MNIENVTILQLVPAPGRLTDESGNVYAGYALVQFDLVPTVTLPDGREIEGGRTTVRDVFPFGTDGGLILRNLDDAAADDLYYGAHGLGDERPRYAQFFGDDGERIEPQETP